MTTAYSGRRDADCETVTGGPDPQSPPGSASVGCGNLELAQEYYSLWMVSPQQKLLSPMDMQSRIAPKTGSVEMPKVREHDPLWIETGPGVLLTLDAESVAETPVADRWRVALELQSAHAHVVVTVGAEMRQCRQLG